MSHYFQPDPSVKQEHRVIKARFGGQPFTFLTNAGVFSKKAIDFGSRLLLDTVTIHPAGKVLDLGCGYGPIGIVVSKLHPMTQTTMVDINPNAINLAQKNAVTNQVANRTDIKVSDGFTEIADEQFDLILFNPPIRAGKAVIYPLFKEAKKHLSANGRLCIVIRKQQGAESAIKELSQWFMDVQLRKQKKGYQIIEAK